MEWALEGLVGGWVDLDGWVEKGMNDGWMGGVDGWMDCERGHGFVSGSVEGSSDGGVTYGG